MYRGDSKYLKHGQPPANADVVVVGAGVAGLYSAWRLLCQNRKRKVVVIEKLGRSGGRLETDHIHLTVTDKDGKTRVKEVKDEEGGMRLNYQMQELIQLSHELELCDQIVNFGMGGNNNRYFVRGESFTVAESKESDNAIWGELYQLAPNEQGKSPVDIITEVYRTILAENGYPDPPSDPQPDFWQRFRLDFTFRGIPLNQWGMWPLLRSYGLSEEAIDMMIDTFGFVGPFLSDAPSAGEAFQILEDFPADPVYYAFNEGFSTLPNTLAKKITEMGGKIYVGATVSSIRRQGEALVVRSSPSPGVQFSDPAKPWRRGSTEASKVILAIPRKAMTALAARSSALRGTARQNLAFQKAMASSAGMVLLKVNLYFQTAWWHDGLSGVPIVADGGNFTSLPAGALYVFDPIERKPGGKAPGPNAPSRNGPAAMTLYCDFQRTDFWTQAQAMGENPAVGYFSSPEQEHYNRQEPQTIFPASNLVVEHMLDQVKQVFNTNAVPTPAFTSFRRWGGEDNFGFAYHQWMQDVDDRQVIALMAKPFADTEIYTCNECWSDMQGWVNGSIRSAEQVLPVHFGTKPLIPDPEKWKSPCTPPPAPPPEPDS